MGTYVLVHGAWHTGKELEPVAGAINAAGHVALRRGRWSRAHSSR
jgi:hypothetical protein